MNIKPVFWFSVIVILAGMAAFFRFNSKGQQLPEGCDQFGFLHMAQAISEGELFSSHTDRAFEQELIADLEKQGFEYRTYAWAIAPHAYHVDPANKKIINQYPPGTSLLLSLISKNGRQIYFGSMMIILLLCIPGIAIFSSFKSPTDQWKALALLFLFGAYGLISEPMLTEFGRINSVAPTYGILLAAGLIFERKPIWSLWLISLSCIFRIANVLLLPPLALFVLLKTSNAQLNHWKPLMMKAVKIGLAILVSGAGLYFTYVWVLLGNPFLPTYSEIDQRVIGLDIVTENLRYYFIENTGWFMLNLTTIVLLILIKWKRNLSKGQFFTFLSLPVIIYGYFIFHFIKTPYYPYAPSLFIAGWLMAWSASHWHVNRKIIAAGVLLASVIFVITGLRSRMDSDPDVPSLSQQSEVYQTEFSDVDILWGDLRSSTFEYATGKPGMRLTWGSPKAVLAIMKWLHEHHYRQAVMLGDFSDENTLEVKRYLKEHLNYQELTTEHFGNILLIP